VIVLDIVDLVEQVRIGDSEDLVLEQSLVGARLVRVFSRLIEVIIHVN